MEGGIDHHLRWGHGRMEQVVMGEIGGNWHVEFELPIRLSNGNAKQTVNYRIWGWGERS